MLISTLCAMFRRFKIYALVTSRHEFVQLRRSNGKPGRPRPGPSFGLMGPTRVRGQGERDGGSLDAPVMVAQQQSRCGVVVNRVRAAQHGAR